MVLKDDNGQPLFPELAPAPNPAQSLPPPDPVPPEPAVLPPAAAVEDIDAAEPAAEPPDLIAAPPVAAAPPPPIDWDSPENPHKIEAERVRQEADRLRLQAQQAQQTAAQMQANALRQADEASQQRHAALVQARQVLDQRVGELTPEEFQRQSAYLQTETAKELTRATAEKKALKHFYETREAHAVWDGVVTQATATYGLSPEQAAYLREHAQNEADLYAQGARIKRDRDDKAAMQAQNQSLTQQLAQLTQTSQQRRSDQAQARRASGADRAGGAGGSVAPTPPPTAPLGILRELLTGDRDTPLRPW